MEEVLSNLAHDATSNKSKTVRDACITATDGLFISRNGTRKLQPYELREKCFLPLKLALESRSSKLSLHAINGLQKLISDDRFRSENEEDAEYQLPVQFLTTVSSTPSLADEVQVEVMKLLLIITCSASCEVHGEYLIKLAEICIETYTRAHQMATKTACRATLTQMLSSVCHRLQDSLTSHVTTKTSSSDSKIVKHTNLLSTDHAKLLSQDVVLLLKHFCFRLTAGPSVPTQGGQAVPLYLESILVMLSSLSTALQQEKEFINVIWQLLCPALIQLLGSPITDLNKRSKTVNQFPEDINRGGRGTGNFAKSSSVVGPIPRTIYNIATELLRLVGPLAAMRPVLESLFHRIILYPPAQQRAEALKALKEFLASPQRLLDAAGPTIVDKENPPSPDSPTEQKKSELDLLRLLMDGIVESARCADSTVASCSVACVVALLGSLEDLSQGRGLSDEHIEFLSKMKEADNLETLKEQYDNAASAREKRNHVNGRFNGESNGSIRGYRWEMNSQGSPDGDIESLTERFEKDGDAWDNLPDGEIRNDVSDDEPEIKPLMPKSVHFASEDEITMFETHESENLKSIRATPPARSGIPRKSSLPKRVSPGYQGNSRTTVKRSSSLDGKTRQKPVIQKRGVSGYPRQRDRAGSDSGNMSDRTTNFLTSLRQNNEKSVNSLGMRRSYSDNDIRISKTSVPQSSTLRKSNSWSLLLPRNDNIATNHNKTQNLTPKRATRGGIPRTHLQTSSNSTLNGRPVLKRWPNDEKTIDVINRKMSDPTSPTQRKFVESKANKLAAREKAMREEKDRSPTKALRTPLRRTRSASEYDRKQQNGTVDKPKGILLKSQSTDEQENARSTSNVPRRNASQGVKINGVYVNKAKDNNTSAKSTPDKKKVKEVKKSVEEDEKEGARNFARCLLGILPSVLSLPDPVVVDEALQQFASDVCEAVTCMALKRKNVPNFGTLRGRSDLVDERSGEGATSDPTYPILNADGVYVTVYATLTLNLKLLKSGYYQKKVAEPALGQEDFINNILNSGVPIGLSSVWLGELYRLVTTYNILGKAGYTAEATETNRALIHTLSDNMLSEGEDSPFLHHRNPSTLPPAKREGMKFARRVLLTTWDSVLDILSVPLETSTLGPANGVSLMLGGESKRDHNRERDTICLSLDGLRRAARLCCTLGIQTRCELVLAQLANASCGGEALYGKRSRSHFSPGHIKLHAAHVLSMDGLLAVGVELGSHAPKCWKHVFRCCTYISQLERVNFSNEVGDQLSHTAPNFQRVNSDMPSPMSESSSISDYFSGELSPNGSGVCRQNSETGSEHESSNSGLLTPTDASRAIYALSAAVDRLFEHAANTLHLEGLLSFLEALVHASRTQLFGSVTERGTNSPGGVSRSSQSPSYSTTLHLYRLADVILRSARNTSRPLLHLMRAWAVISPHFVEAASHKDRHISKLAITSLHDIITELLSNRSELPHFWFHEALFKPLDGIMSSVTCSEDETDQILATLCQLVETHLSSIKSGWRPIFSALRNMPATSRKLTDVTEHDHRPPQILDILSAFLNNKNSSVFAAAAVQCIQTLLRFVRGSECDDAYEGSRSDSESNDNSDAEIANDMCLPALQDLLNLSKKLASIYIMPSSLVFHGSRVVFLVEHTPEYPGTPSPASSPLKPNELSNRKAKNQAPNVTSAASIASIDDTGVLRVWFLLLEGLTKVVAQCPCKYQPQTLEVLFDILRSIITVPGPHFSIYVITNLLLPMLESWVERGNRDGSYWESTAGNFKHACGLVTELVVEELGQFLSVQGAAECVPGMIKQTLDLLLECVSQPVEGIARLGCSCLRHLLLSGGPVFTEDLWLIVSEGLREAVHTTLSNLRDMVACFQPGSYSVNGDEGMTVRIVARRDVITADVIRLQQVAEQVFLLDSQVDNSPKHSKDSHGPANEEDDQRSYVFVLSSVENKEKPENAERVPLRGLLVSLLSHQLLLQTLGSILLDNAESVMAQSSIPGSPGASLESFGSEGAEANLPGLLPYLSPANLSVLFDCLMESHSVAYEFNARPGLRSLIQKLAKLDAPANLLRQSTTAFTCYLHTLFQICRHSGEHFSSSNIKRILTGDRVTNSQDKEDDTGKDESLGTPARHNDLLKGDRNLDWIVRRLNEACDQLSSVYVRLYNQYKSDSPGNMSFEIELERSMSLSSTSSPARNTADELLSSPQGRWKLSAETISRDSKSRHYQQLLEDDLRMVELERQFLKRKEDELLQVNIWTNLVVTMLELLLSLPTLQFKAVLPAVFPAVTCLISTGADTRVKQLVCEVVRRVGSIYGIL